MRKDHLPKISVTDLLYEQSFLFIISVIFRIFCTNNLLYCFFLYVIGNNLKKNLGGNNLIFPQYLVHDILFIVELKLNVKI